MRVRSIATCGVLALSACGTPETVFVFDSSVQSDQPTSDSVSADLSQRDADVAEDVGVIDVGPTDTGPVTVDTGPVDTGPVDTGPVAVDTGPADTGPADTGPADTGPIDAGVICPSGFNDCDGNATNGCEANTQTNVAHCGMCGRRCNSPVGGSAACVAGTCTSSCPSGQTNCSGTCRTLGTDASNCGACDRACSTGQTCTGGDCVTSSQCFSLDFTAGGYAEVPRTPMLDMTSTWSVTFWARARVTGSNGNFWTDGYEERAWSSYAVVPLGGQVAYAARSANTISGTTLLAPNAPGATNAGTVLTGIFLPASSWAHVAVVVDRTSGRAYLDGVMRHDVTLRDVDPFQPGYDFRVGNYLAVANRPSFDGYLSDIAVWRRALTASEVTTLASGNPGMLRTDPSLAVWLAAEEGNGTRVADVSGRNNHATLTGARWVASCPPHCDSGLSSCAGACRNLASDTNHCGACGMACPTRSNATSTCLSGTCGITCNIGFTDCDGNMANGCEANTQTNVAHCGMCGRTCNAPVGGSATCVAGTCTSSCPSGQTNCSETCRTLGTDASNCGACGITCATGQTCTGGTCRTSCATGQSLCNDTCVNLQTDPANCGACGRRCESGHVCASGTCAGQPNMLILGYGSGTTNPKRYCVSTTDGSAGSWSCGTLGPLTDASLFVSGLGPAVANGRYWIGTADRNVWSSPDGSTWTLAATLTHPFVDVEYGGGLYVATSNTTAMSTSRDGVTWTPLVAPFTTRYVARVGTRWVVSSATSSEHRVLVSDDGVTFTPVDVGVTAPNNPQLAQCSDGSLFVAHPANGAGQLTRTLDGLVWSRIALTSGTFSASYSTHFIRCHGGALVSWGDDGSYNFFQRLSMGGSAWERRTVYAGYDNTRAIPAGSAFDAAANVLIANGPFYGGGGGTVAAANSYYRASGPTGVISHERISTMPFAAINPYIGAPASLNEVVGGL